jgi:hypothetical protein
MYMNPEILQHALITGEGPSKPVSTRSAPSPISTCRLLFMRSLFKPILVMVLLISAIIASGQWIYRATESTFTLQDNLRLAQFMRDRIVRVRLAIKGDVESYAVTHDKRYFKTYAHHIKSMNTYQDKLATLLHGVDPTYNLQALQNEKNFFGEWQHQVAEPILYAAHPPTQHIILVTEPLLAKSFLAEDAKIQDWLNASFKRAEIDHTLLMRRLMIGRVFFALCGLTIVGALLWIREKEQRLHIMRATEAQDQLRFAQTLQESLVPDVMPHISGVRLYDVYVPASFAHTVGGDWYDVLPLSDTKLLLIIGDVAGHGLDAAILMNQARQSLISAAVMNHDPAAILMNANTLLTRRYGCMVTALCCILDMQTLELRYASAGHPPPVLVSSVTAHVEMLNYGGPPLGFFDDIELVTEHRTIDRDTCVYLYTDGLLENEKDAISGEQRIKAAAAQSCHSDNPAITLYEDVMGDKKPRDDVAIVALLIG